MKAGDVRICPSCQARNKPKWEFCVRCGESLQGVAAGKTEAAAAPKAAAADEAVERHAEASARFWLVTLGGLAAFVIAGVAAWKWLGAGAASSVTTGVVAVPTLP